MKSLGGCLQHKRMDVSNRRRVWKQALTSCRWSWKSTGGDIPKSVQFSGDGKVACSSGETWRWEVTGLQTATCMWGGGRYMFLFFDQELNSFECRDGNWTIRVKGERTSTVPTVRVTQATMARPSVTCCATTASRTERRPRRPPLRPHQRRSWRSGPVGADLTGQILALAQFTRHCTSPSGPVPRCR